MLAWQIFWLWMHLLSDSMSLSQEGISVMLTNCHIKILISISPGFCTEKIALNMTTVHCVTFVHSKLRGCHTKSKFLSSETWQHWKKSFNMTISLYDTFVRSQQCQAIRLPLYSCPPRTATASCFMADAVIIIAIFILPGRGSSMEARVVDSRSVTN